MPSQHSPHAHTCRRWWVGMASSVKSYSRWLRLWPRYTMAHCIPNGPFWSLPLSVSSARLLLHASNTKTQHSANTASRVCSALLMMATASVDAEAPQRGREGNLNFGVALQNTADVFWWCIYSCSHLARLHPVWMRARWEEIVYDNCHDTRAPHKFSLFARPLFLSSLFWLSRLLAIISKLIYMLMSPETDVYCHTQMPDFPRCSSKGQARGEVRQVFWLVNVRLWNTGLDTH